MMQTPSLLSKVRKWLKMLPPGTVVDPAGFPESDFPVRCMGCSYTLTGLPDGRCPECGREFTRGRLLVEQYALCRIPRRGGWYGVARKCYWIGYVSIAIVFTLRVIASIVLSRLADAQNPALSIDAIGIAIFSILDWQLAACAGLLAGSITHGLLLPPRANRDAVRAALGLPLLRDQWKFRWK